MGVQLQQLRYLVRVAEEQHFTRAAASLHMAQPSVSNAIRALEAELGAALFHRTHGRVTLTTAGEVLLPWARQILADCDSARAAVQDLSALRRGRLALGATPSLTTNLLPPLLAEFHNRHPGIDLVLDEAGSRHLVNRLEQGQLDLAILILPVKQSWVRTASLIDEELVVAVNEDHPLAGRATISVAELEGVPLVMFRDGYDLRESTIAACRGAGFEPTLAIEGGEMDGVLALTEAGLGAAVVPATVIRPVGPLRAVRFAEASLTRTIGLAARRDRPLAQAARVFVQELHGLLAAAPPVEGISNHRSPRPVWTP